MIKIAIEKNHEVRLNGFNEIISIDDQENESIIYQNGKREIEIYFDNRLIPVHSSDGDPQKETSERISGIEYIKIIFGGDYDEALEELINELRP